MGQLGTAGLRVPMLIRRKAVIARLAAVFDDKIVAREPAYGVSPAVADDYSDFYDPSFGLDDV